MSAFNETKTVDTYLYTKNNRHNNIITFSV